MNEETINLLFERGILLGSDLIEKLDLDTLEKMSMQNDMVVATSD